MWKIFSLFFLGVMGVCFATTQPPSYEFLYEQAKEFNDFLIEKRRWLHQHPELYFEEFETSQYIQETLTEMGVNFTAGWGKNYFDENSPPGTGVVAEIGNGAEPCIALRADIDGLPIQEDNDFPFKSINDGKMHACGHDTHAAMLLGAAKLLKQNEDKIEGTVRLMFQPGEEGGGGGHMMAEEGVLEKFPPAQMAMGMHVAGNYPTGTMVSGIGPLGAAATDFIIKVKGKGGHAAMHHLTIDPIPAGVAIVRAIYDLYARELYFQPETAGLISVCIFKTTSSATNVIPDEVTIGGTIRALKTKTREYIKNRIEVIVKEISESYRCTSTITQKMIVPYPALENDPIAFHVFNEGIKTINHGQGALIEQPIMGGEDFSFFSEKIPSVFVSIGSGSGAEIPGHPATDVMAHQSKFAVDERVLPMGSAHYAYFAFNALHKFNSEAMEKMDAEPEHDEF